MKQGFYPQPSHQYSYGSQGEYSGPIHTNYGVQYLEVNPLITQPQVSHVQKQKKSCCGSALTGIVLLLVLACSATALTLSLIRFLEPLKGDREIVGEYALIGGVPKTLTTPDSPFVVSYQALGTPSLGVAAGFGHSIIEDKPVKSYDYTPIVIDASTKVTPYKDAVIVASINFSSNQLRVNVIKNGQGGYDNYIINQVHKILDLVCYDQENGHCLLLYIPKDGTNGRVYALTFTMQSNFVTQRHNIINITPTYSTSIYTSGFVKVLSRSEYRYIISIIVGTQTNHEPKICTIRSHSLLCDAESLVLSTASGVPSVVTLPSLPFDQTRLRYAIISAGQTYGFEYKKLRDVNVHSTRVDFPFSTLQYNHRVEQVGDDFIGYHVDNYSNLKACVFSTVSYNKFTSCLSTSVQVSPILKNSQVTLAVAGSQLFFSVTTDDGVSRVIVMGVSSDGTTKQLIIGNSYKTSDISNSVTVPILTGINYQTVSLLYPQEPKAQQTIRAVTFGVSGGLNPVGIVQHDKFKKNKYVELKTDMFTLPHRSSASFIAGARYYSDVMIYGALTTTKPAKESRLVGVALDTKNLKIKLYEL